MNNQHSILAPSGAKRWVHCQASPIFIEANLDRLPSDESEYAAEGTEAHDWAANILNGLNSIDEIPVEEMRECVGDYLQLCESLKESEHYKGATNFVEEKVPLFYRPQDKGTIDFALIRDDKVYILDLKYGKGVPVEAKDNYQMAIYALSVIQEYEAIHDFTDETLVTMTIFQPRCFEGTPTKIWAVSLKELREGIGTEILQAAANIQETMKRLEAKQPADRLPFAPEAEGACRFCLAKHICKARAEHAQCEFDQEGLNAVAMLNDESIREGELAVPEGSVPAFPPFESLTDSQIACIAEHGPAVIKWINEVIGGAQGALESGRQINGLKLVQGRPGNRRWADEEHAEKFLKGQKVSAKDLFKKSLVSPAQAEKLLKGKELTTKAKNIWATLITQSEGKPTLTIDNDPRQALNTGADAFENIEEVPDGDLL
jgi:hypothetical protein